MTYSGSRPEIVPYVPEGATSLLDVGCAEGGFGAQLRQERPGLRLWAVEPDQAMAAAAAAIYDRVIRARFEDALADLPTGAFDVVTFTDVLEHLVDPGSALVRTRPLLSTEGVVLASIPNVRNYAVWKPLILHGEWRYRDFGLLDRTHLRFFTRSSIEELFAHAGYRIRLIEGINMTTTMGRKTRAVSRLTRRFDDFLFVQFLVIAEVA
jgi:2-polyprenyl-3-methyl-5-hydroxy-6-metoxy-1,4-benzoquinol methylase